MNKFLNRVGFILMWVCGIATALLILCIFQFLYMDTKEFFKEYSFWDFVFQMKWKPTAGQYGLLPMIFGSVVTTVLAVLMALPLGVLSMLYIRYYCSVKIRQSFEFLIHVLAGIPSVVYGVFALVVLCPLIRNVFGGSGFSLLTTALLLSLMILPTIMTLYMSELSSIPTEYYANALALGESKEKSIIKCILPMSSYGIISSAILSIGRAIGETMAVLMIAGNSTVISGNWLEGIRTLTTNISLEMGYATGQHRMALIASGLILLIIILFLEMLLFLLKRKITHEK